MCAVGANFLEDSYQDPNTPVGSRGLKGTLKGTIPQSATCFDSSQYQRDNTVNVVFLPSDFSRGRKSPLMMSNASFEVIGDFPVKDT